MSPVKIGVLISGGGTNLQAVIDNTKNGNINGEIKLIISNKKEAYGLKRGEIAGIETLYIDSKSFDSDRDYNLKIIKEFKDRDVELIILAGYLKVLSPEFIKEFKDKIINIHPSLIPQFSGKGYYGDRVHTEVLKSGVKTTGATVHFVDEGTDTGPIILQEKVDVNCKDDLDSLKKKVLSLEHKLLVQAVKLYCEDRIKIEGRLVITN
jgi:phosphoribosylglycinamide formyltransferase-1